MTRWQEAERQQDTRLVTETVLAELSAFVAKRMGLRFPRERWGDLERGLRSAAREFGAEDPEACAQWLVSSPPNRRQVEILASHLTVGETYLFRDKPGLDAFEHRILPQLIRSRRRSGRHLKIWSAGCATGEEPYSLAILLSATIPDLSEWKIDIVGTDINARFLDKASKGEYGQWSFRRAPGWVRDRYFTTNGNGKSQIIPRIKEMVKFQYLNLAEDAYPAFMNNLYAMDVILCRNVLLYFVAEQALRAVNGLYRSLVDGGWLIVGPSDLLHIKPSGFSPVDSKSPNLYRKDVNGSLAPREERRVEPAPSVEPLPTPEAPRPRPERRKAVSERQVPRLKPAAPGPRPKQPAEALQYAEALELYQAGHYEAAVDELLDLLSGTQGPNEPGQPAKGTALLARAYANQGNLAEALVWCERAIAAEKVDPAGYYLRASILQEQGRIEEAAVAIRQTLFLDPGFVLGHFVMGNLARVRDNGEKPEKHFANARRLLRRYPEDAILSESEGITAGRLAAIIESMTERSA